MSTDYFTGTPGSIVVCINPLTSIMMEQSSKFKSRGINVEFVNEETDTCHRKRITKGEVQRVFISPESFLNNGMHRNMLLSPK